jgi:tetratricopeptide (TPR) repeat protein
MPRAWVRNRWLVPALACFAIVTSVALGVVGWIKTHHGAGALLRGQAAYDKRDWAVAEKIAREQLKQDRGNPDALRLLSRALFRQSRDQPAVAISESLDRDTMTAEDYFLLGQSCVRSQKSDVAIKLWQKTTRLDPNHVESRVALEQAFFRLDRLSEAEKEADSLLDVPGRAALAELMRGQIFSQKSDPAGASAAFERAVERPEEWASMVEPLGVRKQLARTLLQTGQAARAREQLVRVTGNDLDPETCWLLSRCDLQESIPSEPAVSAQSQAYRASHPLEPEPAPYVGEARCAGCHAEIFRDQHQSRHARTFSRRDQLGPVPFPQHPIPDPTNPRVLHSFQKSADGVEVQTRSDGQVYRTMVEYAFGSGDRGLTPVGHDENGRALECRLSYYPDRVGWDVTTGQSLAPNQPAASYPGKALSADDLRHCMECHNTNPHAIRTGTGPESQDRAIGCEKCHGPGGHHLKVVSSHDFSSSRDVDLAIARPSLASGSAVVGLCAQCHSPRRNSSMVDPESPSSVRFQGATLTRSRCYIESEMKLSCVNCHNPHRNAEASSEWFESRCLQCHRAADGIVDRKGGTAGGANEGHYASCPVQPATGCIACHMPKRESTMAHTAFTDHFIRVHREPDALGATRP